MPKRKGIIILFMLLFLSLYLSGTKGGIKGLVVDNQKKPIEGVAVTIIPLEYPSTQYVLKTNKKGEFFQIGLDPDYYQVRCEKDGYMPESARIKVSISEIAEAFITLNPVTPHLEVRTISGSAESKKAYQLYLDGKLEEAATEYRAAIEKNPGEASNYFNLGVMWMALNKFDEAVEAFKRAIEIQPQNFSALKYLGQIYSNENAYDEAEKYYRLASKVSAEDPEIFYNIGIIRMKAGDYPGAAEAFKKSIACDSHYADAIYQLGLIYLNQNQLLDALDAFEKFLKVSPDDPKAENVKKMIEIIRK